MVIPGARFDDAPPPLPPPRYNEELAHGIDIAWSWGNTDPFHPKRRLAPIKPGSSLYGGYLESRSSNFAVARDADDMDLDDDYPRRGSNVSTVRSPSQAEIRQGAPVPTFTRKPPSPTLANQRLVFPFLTSPAFPAWAAGVLFFPLYRHSTVNQSSQYRIDGSLDVDAVTFT